jgi:hypothetical protein
MKIVSWLLAGGAAGGIAGGKIVAPMFAAANLVHNQWGV